MPTKRKAEQLQKINRNLIGIRHDTVRRHRNAESPIQKLQLLKHAVCERRLRNFSSSSMRFLLNSLLPTKCVSDEELRLSHSYEGIIYQACPLPTRPL